MTVVGKVSPVMTKTGRWQGKGVKDLIGFGCIHKSNYFQHNSVFEIRNFDDIVLVLFFPRFDKTYDAIDKKRN